MSVASTFTEEEQMLKGLPASPGISIGKACLCRLEKVTVQADKISPDQSERNYALFRRARLGITMELKELRNEEPDRETADIIETQIEIIQDPDLAGRIHHLIFERHFNAAFAISEAFRTYLDIVKQTENPVFLERISDIKEMRDRLIRHVQEKPHRIQIRPSSIVITDELSPTDLIQYAKHNLKALALDSGGLTSHTSIIAHSMGIPAVVGCKKISHVVQTGGQVIVDGNDGKVIVNPSRETLRHYRTLLGEQKRQERRLQSIVEEPNETACGHPFSLRANIEFKEELINVKKFRALGIGLLRTESLYMARKSFQDQQTQLEFYRQILRDTDNHPVTIRLFDAGGDKFIDQSVDEANPFLGWRGIRMLLNDRILLRNQLYAMARTAGEFPGRIKILVPMISVLEEIIEVRNELDTIQEKLQREGLPIDEELSLGIMVEVPSTAVQLKSFAPYIDFCSIGTNDLTQYTLAVDRGNDRISHLYQQKHPAILRLISIVAQQAVEMNLNIAVCGEMAADPDSAASLVGLGITDLSMSPASIPRVKDRLRHRQLSEMQSLANEILEAHTQHDVEDIMNDWNNR